MPNALGSTILKRATSLDRPPLTDPAQLVAAPLDALNPPFTAAALELFYNATFVDDNGVLALARLMTLAVYQSVIAAFILFGWPDGDRRASCLAQDKWEP
jgi:hypothetical protein